MSRSYPYPPIWYVGVRTHSRRLFKFFCAEVFGFATGLHFSGIPKDSYIVYLF